MIRRLLVPSLRPAVSDAVSALCEGPPWTKLGGQNKEEVATNPFTYFAKRVTHGQTV